MDYSQLSKEQLTGIIEDFARNWLAHDGLWFQQVEMNYGIEKALELDIEAWRVFTAIEAKRIMTRHNIEPNSGLEGFKKALGYRLYAFINKQEIRNETDNSFEFYMVDCRVPSARQRKNMPLFPCKEVGLVEYRLFAETIDPRIKMDVIGCPPDKHAGKDFFCGWKFYIEYSIRCTKLL